METELDFCWRSEDSGDDSTEDDVQDVLVSVFPISLLYLLSLLRNKMPSNVISDLDPLSICLFRRLFFLTSCQTLSCLSSETIWHLSQMSLSSDIATDSLDSVTLCNRKKQEWATSGGNVSGSGGRYNLVIINDRLMSEAVQTEHSYFHHDMDDDDSSHDAEMIVSRTSSFKGMFVSKVTYCSFSSLQFYCSCALVLFLYDSKVISVQSLFDYSYNQLLVVWVIFFFWEVNDEEGRKIPSFLSLQWRSIAWFTSGTSTWCITIVTVSDLHSLDLIGDTIFLVSGASLFIDSFPLFSTSRQSDW